MRILYGKIGRATNLDRTKLSTLGGDVDVLNFLERLARNRPQDEIIIVSRNSGEDPQSVGLPANVSNVWHGTRSLRTEGETALDIAERAFEHVYPYFETADAVVIWAGQHGSSNLPIPKIGASSWDDELTNPQDSMVRYTGWLLRGINVWREQDPLGREEIWLLPDVRNYIKARDIKWPLRRPILAQFNKRHVTKHERYRDTSDNHRELFNAQWEGTAWVSSVEQVYSGLEMTALPDPQSYKMPTLEGRKPFGMIVNENRKEVRYSRLQALLEWVTPHRSDTEIYGTWSCESQQRLGRVITPVPHVEAFDHMGRWRCTFTTPASGSGWATAKPWEAFLTGTICFFHPGYDTQNNILGQLDPDAYGLAKWLRVTSAAQLHARIDYLCSHDDVYHELALQQRLFVERVFAEDKIGQMVKARLEHA